MTLHKFRWAQIILILVFSVLSSETLALGEVTNAGRCRQILALEQSEDGQSDWAYQQPQAFGILDIIRAPERANDHIVTFILNRKRLPTVDELQEKMLSSIPKKFRAMFRDSNVLDHDDEAIEILAEEFVEEFSQEFYDFMMSPRPLVSIRNTKQEVVEAGLFDNYDELVLALQRSSPESYARLERRVANQAMLWFSQKLVPPTVRQLAAVMGFDMVTGIHILFAITKDDAMWRRASRSDAYMLSMQRAEGRVIQAYARAVRGTDTPHAFRTRKIQPTNRRITEVMGLTRENTWYRSRLLSGLNGRFDLTNEDERAQAMAILEHQLAHMIGATDAEGNPIDVNQDEAYNNPEWIFGMPQLFGSVDELHDAARTMFRGTFNSYVNSDVMNLQNGEALIEKIEQSRGMVISSFTPGREINWELVEGMKAKAKEEGKTLVLIPDKGGTLEGTDERLLSDPEINILPTTVANNYLKLWLYPNSDRSRAFSGIKTIENYRHGSTVIVPHHTMEHEVRPSGTNHLSPTKLYSTGSINFGAVGGVGAAQSAKAEKITNQIKQGFLVVEKVNSKNESLSLHNRWHIRPVEWRNQTERGDAGFTDGGVKYKFTMDEDGRFQWKVVRNKPRVFYLPDVHFISANPEVMRGLVSYIRSQVEEGDEISFVLPDPIDSKAINHHVEKTQGDVRALHRMLRDGSLDFNREMNDAVANVNELLELFPSANILFQYSNHSDEWIQRNLLNQPTLLQTVVNGPIIRELGAALDANPGMTALEYLLTEREEMQIAMDRRDTRKHYESNVYISDVRRVRVLRPGDALPGNRDPEYNTFSHNHGHKGANGAKGAPASHAEGFHRQITGDRHTPGYQARGTNFWAGVGASSLVQPYTRQGGYSSWGLAMAQVYDDGTMTLIYMDQITQNFVQDPDADVAAPEVFFGDTPLQAADPVDNDELRRQRDTELFNEYLDDSIPRFQEGVLAP